MPRVPQQSLQSGPMPRFEAPGVVPFEDQSSKQLSQFGQSVAQFGASIDAVGDSMQRQEREMRDEIDEARIRTRVLQITEKAATIGMNFEALKGTAALDAHEKALKAIDSDLQPLGEGMENDTQGRFVSQAMERERANLRMKINGHALQQARVSSIGSAEAAILQQKREMIELAIAGKPATASEYEKFISEGVDELARMNGWTQAQTDFRKLQEKFDVHNRVLDSLSEKPGSAKDWLDRFGDKIPGELRQQAEKRIEVAQVAQDATTLSLILPQKPPADITGVRSEQQGPMSPAESLLAQRRFALDEQMRIKNDLDKAVLNGEERNGIKITPKVRDQVIERMEKDYNNERQFFAERSAITLRMASEALRNNPGLPAAGVVDNESIVELQAAGLWNNLVATKGRFVTTEEGNRDAGNATDADFLPGGQYDTGEKIDAEFRYRLDDQDLDRLKTRLQSVSGRTEKERADAFAIMSRDDSVEAAGREMLNMKYPSFPLGPGKDGLDKDQIAMLNAWRFAAKQRWDDHRKLKPLDTVWDFLRKEKAETVLAEDQKTMVPRTTMFGVTDDDQLFRFRGIPFRKADIPERVTIMDGGNKVTITQKQAASMLLKELKREPRWQEVFDYMTKKGVYEGPLPQPVRDRGGSTGHGQAFKK